MSPKNFSLASGAINAHARPANTMPGSEPSLHVLSTLVSDGFLLYGREDLLKAREAIDYALGEQVEE